MSTKYTHTNIICENWRTMAKFYTDVFDCVLVPPKREQSGEWLEKGTAVENAALEGVHLRLPGHGKNGPTLEIYSYKQMVEQSEPVANRKGYGHLAFSVSNVATKLKEVVTNGGSTLGEVVIKEVPEVGTITFAYAKDPEGNIIEIQNWS